MNDINIIKDSLKRSRHELELNDIKSFSNSNSDIQNRLNYLLSELNKINNKKSNSTIIKSTSNEELTSLFNKMDHNIQSQPWNKLPKFIQNQKIQEFISTKESNSDKAKEYYKLIYNDILSKKIKTKDIIYDQKQCIITNINKIENYF